MAAPTIAIIGAGIAGILSAKYALENGLKPFAFEKSKAIGGLWSLDSSFIYEGLVANASIYRQMFSDHPWPENANTFPTSIEINSYLMSYVKRFSLNKHIYLNTKVVSVEKVEGQKWQIKTKKLIGSSEAVSIFDFVIVASGEHATPRIPNIQNAINFEGIQMHSSEFKQKDLRLKSKIVVVLGGAFSGTEISENLVDHAKQVINIFRTPHLHCQKLIKHQKPISKDETQCTYLPWDLYFFRRGFKHTQQTNKQSQIELYSDLFAEQTNKSLSHPALFCDLKTQTHPIQITLSNNYIKFVKENKIVPIRSSIKKMKRNGIVLDDNRFVECDVVVYCTGYNKNFDDFLELIQVKFDNLGVKSLINNSLYKWTFHPDITNLAFVGLATGLLYTGIELQSKWATMVFSGKIKLPSRLDMIRNIEKVKEETNPFNLVLFFSDGGGHLSLSDRIAVEMDLVPNFDDLKKNDPYSFDLLWNYAMCATHYLFKKDKEFSLKIMNKIKALGEF